MPDDDALLHPDQPRVLFSAWIWAVTLFIFFGVIVIIIFGTMDRGSTYESERAKNREGKLKTAREGWAKAENSYAWVDQAKGVARIPVERAMQLEMADLQSRKPAPAGPIATPEAGAVPVSATGTAQPQSTTPTPSPAESPTPKPFSGEGLNSENRAQPAAAANPPNAPAGTQPGASATPGESPGSHSVQPAVSPSGTPVQHPVGTPLPIAGKTPPPSATPTATPSPTR